MTKPKLDRAIKTIEDVIKKWEGKIPAAILLDEIKLDYHAYTTAKQYIPRYETSKLLPTEPEVYQFIDFGIQFHYHLGHYENDKRKKEM